MRMFQHSIQAMALVLWLPTGSAMAGDTHRTPAAGTATTPTCTASAFHPLNIHVTALDAITRGAVVRLRLSASASVGMDQVEARLVSTGGALSRGASRLALGALTPGRVAEGVFTVAIPALGGRQYLQFQVVGQGPQGTLTRGACYNLLPDGPAQYGRLVLTPEGARVLEVAARRID